MPFIPTLEEDGDFWHHTVQACIQISVLAVTAALTDEYRLRYSVFGSSISAPAASLTGMARIYQHNSFTLKFGFVFYFADKFSRTGSQQRPIKSGFCAYMGAGVLCSTPCRFGHAVYGQFLSRDAVVLLQQFSAALVLPVRINILLFSMQSAYPVINFPPGAGAFSPALERALRPADFFFSTHLMRSCASAP